MKALILELRQFPVASRSLRGVMLDGLKRLLAANSFAVSVVYTLGHILIAVITVKVISGASWFDSGLVALVEPMINGVWFYVLHHLVQQLRA
jgi:uncharacterized membrane protein